MKKIILGALAIFLVAQAFALNITDPFYMPKKEGFVLDSTAFKQNSGQMRAYGISEELQYGVMDNFAIGVGLTWGKIKDGNDGFLDPVFSARYRIVEEAKNGLIVDLKGYISPSVFDSPNDGDRDGIADGSTDFGFSAMAGSREWAKDFVFWGEAGVDFIGSAKYTKSSNVLFISGNAKYYMDDLNSFDGGLFLKHYSAGDGYNGYGIRLDYARVLADNLALVPFWSAESHSDDVPSDVQFGVTLRLTF